MRRDHGDEALGGGTHRPRDGGGQDHGVEPLGSGAGRPRDGGGWDRGDDPVGRGTRRPGDGGGQDRGSGSVLVVALVAVVAILAAGVVVLGRAQVARAQAQAAADLAALAGASALWVPPDIAVDVDRPGAVGCAVAEEVAARNGARVAECRTDGAEIRVVVHLPAGVGVAVGRARAGPDDGDG